MTTGVDKNRVGTHRRLEFTVGQKNIFNTNMNIKHYMQKAKLVDTIRAMGAKAGAEAHPDRETVEARLDALRQERRIAARKVSTTKKMAKRGASQEEIDKEMQEITESLSPATPSSHIQVTPLFTTFKITMTVRPPTRRRLDPPNLSPTLKALVDGLTDACWWDDDDYRHLVETSFRYGGLSGTPGKWRIVLDVEEVDPSGYVTSN